MKKIKYSSKGIPIQDNLAENFVLHFLKSNKQFLHVSTENCIYYARIWVKRGITDHKDLIFEYDSEIINIYQDARLDNWPTGFCDWQDKVLAELM